MLATKMIISLDDVKKEILELCLEPHTPAAILEHIKVDDTKSNHKKFIIQLLNKRFIISAFLRKRISINQKFIITQKGLNYLKAIA